jgi:hypothetical protein
MKPKTVFMVVLVAVVSLSPRLTPPLSAQMFGGMGAQEVRGVFKPVVGSGATYETVKTDGRKAQFDIAIVDKEPSGGYWTEYSIEDPRTKGTVYMKSLILAQGDEAVVQRTIVQMPGRPPMEMSSLMQGMGHPKQNQKIDVRAEAQNLGTESVTTPAGTFSCQHWRTTKEGTDVWISDRVTPWGLVKMSGKDASSIILVRVITGARSHITGVPVSMEEMMKGMGKQ